MLIKGVLKYRVENITDSAQLEEVNRAYCASFVGTHHDVEEMELINLRYVKRRIKMLNESNYISTYTLL